MYRINHAVVVLLGTAVLFYMATSRSLAADGATYDTVKVVGKDAPFIEKLELRGASLHGFETTDVMSKLAGYVAKIHSVVDGGEAVDIGSAVVAGQVLVELYVPEMKDEMAEKGAELGQAKAAVEQAGAAVEEAKAEVVTRAAEVQQAKAMQKQKRAIVSYREAQFERVLGLFERGVVDEESKIEAQFALAAARAEFVTVDEVEFYPGVKIAEAHAVAAAAAEKRAVADLKLAREKVNVAEATIGKLETMQQYTMIKAPFKGIVTRRMVDHGAFVRPPSNSGAMPLFTITRVDKVRVVVSVPNTKASKVQKGQAVVLDRIGGLKGVAIQGNVSRIANVLAKGSRMMRIEVDIQNPADDVFTKNKIVLRPGMYATVNVKVNEYEAIPVVPTKSVATDSAGRDFVVTIRDGKPVKQVVEIAFDDAVTIGLSKGVRIGDQVLKNASSY